jgi:peptidoglycan glycosyltransferase
VAHEWLVGIPPVPTLEEAARWVERHPRGNDVNLTLDLRLQGVADRALGPRRGAVIALDPRTGEVLAAVSHPSFDPADVARRWQDLQRDPMRPLLCRATQGLYPPGSSFKLVTAAAALEAGVMRPGTPCFCGGAFFIGSYRIPCFRGTVHGGLTFEEAVARSCNVTFARVGTRLGDQRLLAQAARFGLGQPIPGDLETSRSRIPPPDRRLRRAIVAQLAFGQGPVAVTPIQMALIGASIANGGVMMRPGIVHSVVSPEGERLARFTPHPLRRVMSRATADALRAMMTRGVAGGTGGRARLPGVAVAGKTGTAQNPHGEDHAWFIGFAPADKPRIAVAVIVEHGGIGGRVAAPVARDVLAAALGIAPDEAPRKGGRPVLTRRERIGGRMRGSAAGR